MRVLALIFAVAVLNLFGQIPTAQMVGLITDPTGAVVPGARVEAANVDTGARWETTSNTAGYYTVQALPPGDYRITVTKVGFLSTTRTGLNLVVAQSARVDFKMVVGAVSQSVEVAGAAPLLESQTAALGQVVQTQAINDLPLNGRNYLELAKLTAGVMEPSRGDRTAGSGGFVANGVRAQLTNYNLDGADNNSRIVDIQNLSYEVIQPSIDALQEFKIETNNYSAEYGYSAGAVVNAAIKSGSNRFHGDAFEFLRNDHLDARSFFLAPNAPKQRHQRNQFGATLGGPVIRNKTFFFFSWERTAENLGLALVTTLPSPAQRAGDFAGLRPIFDPATLAPNPHGPGFVRSPFPGNIIPAARISDVSAKLAAMLPAAVLPGAANNFVSSPSQIDRIHRFDTRGDQNISDNDKFFGRFSYLTRSFLNPGPFPAPVIGATSQEQNLKSTAAHSATVGETHIFSPALLNEANIGYSRIYDLRGDAVSGPFLGPQLGFRGIPPAPGVSGLPGISISGYTNLGERDFVPNGKVAEVLQFKDDFSWIRGTHSFKFGGQYEWVRSFYNISGSARGIFSFTPVFTQDPQNRAATGDAFGDFLLGIPADSSISVPSVGDVRQTYMALFAQDDWKATARLTVNFGLRWEVWTPRFERHGQQANFIPGLDKFIFPENKYPGGIPQSLVGSIPEGIGDRTLVRQYSHNFAPRLGVAYQLTPKMVLRAGGGIFYASPMFPGVGATPPGNPPFFLTSDYPTDQINPNLTFAGGFPADALAIKTINPLSASFRSFDPNFKPAYVSKWSLGVQRQVRQYLFEANYVGTTGTHLPLFYDLNQPLAGPGTVPSRRPIQGIGSMSYTTPMDSSNYHALEARVERRYANGLSLLASYTYSRTIDDGGEQLIGDLMLRDVLNVKDERSLALFDMRHRLVFSYVYDLPFGQGKHFRMGNPVVNAVLGNWQINGITTIRSGQPFTPQMGFSAANAGNARPDRIGNGNLPRGQRTVQRWFDKAAFIAPTPYNYGDAGRNILTAPGAVNFDFSTFKQVPVKPLGEAGLVQFRAEFFNIFNHPQFGAPNARIDIPQGGTITSLSTAMRQIQFGLKVIF